MRSHAVELGGPLLAALGALLAGCANPLNAYNYWHYFDCGLSASRAGDHDTAAKCFSRAAVNARVGWLGPEAESAALYDYGRAAGQLCAYDAARRSFERALELEESLDEQHPVHLGQRLFELARLSFDTGQYAEAVRWYERGFPVVRKLAADRADPIAFADELDDFATALEHTGDFGRAAAQRQESALIRADHPGALAGFAAEHYPKDCAKS